MVDRSVLRAAADEPEAALQSHRLEYQEIGANLRHYANLQFAQLSIAMVVAGAIATALGTWPHENIPLVRLLLCVLGVVMSVCFLAMSLRVTDYWDKNLERAREIECLVGMSIYLVRPPIPRVLSNRTAVAIVYWTLAATFGLLAALFGGACALKLAPAWGWGS